LESGLWVAAVVVIAFGVLLTQAVPGEAASHGSSDPQSRRVPLRPAAPGAQITVTLRFTPRHARWASDWKESFLLATGVDPRLGA